MREKLKKIRQFIKLSFFSPRVGDRLNITVESNGIMEPINVIALGRNGIIHSESFIESTGRQSFQLFVDVTPEMSPQTSLILFYTRDSDGEMVYDEIKLHLELQTENKVSVS